MSSFNTLRDEWSEASIEVIIICRDLNAVNDNATKSWKKCYIVQVVR